MPKDLQELAKLILTPAALVDKGPYQLLNSYLMINLQDLQREIHTPLGEKSDCIRCHH